MVNTIRILAIAAALALLAWSTPSHATNCKNGAKNYPTCTLPAPAPAPAPNVTANPAAAADAKADAAAGALAGAAVVAPIDVKSTAKSGDLTNEIDGDTINSRSKSWALGLVLPQSAPTLPPMSKIDCPTARIEQSASTGWGWGATPGKAASSTNPIGCERVTLINAKIESCQYADAQRMMDLYASEIFKGYEAKTYLSDDVEQNKRFNLDPETCALQREVREVMRLKVKNPAPVTHNYIYTAPPVEDKKVEPPPAEAKKMPPKPRAPKVARPPAFPPPTPGMFEPPCPQGTKATCVPKTS